MTRWVGLAAALVLLAFGVLTWVNRPDTSPGSAPPLAGVPPTADLLARGEYLTHAADCVACHTVADSSRPFAGGVPFKLPVGTLYSTNITADEETGIGRWTDDQFVRAVQRGVRNDGAHLYPAFPYTSFTGMPRADVLAIKAYLFAQPRVHLKNRKNDLSFPFDQRWAMQLWNAVFFRDQRFIADSAKSADWNRGAYLATALGHCGECHTPRNFAFALKQGEALTGEVLQGWRAYNITADANHGIGAWSDAEIAQYLATGHATGRATAGGPMGEVVANSLQYLAPEDIAALVIYLRGVPARSGSQPVTHGAAAVARDAAPAEPPTMGAKLFEGACSSCHRSNGEGLQSPYAALTSTRGVNDPAGTNVVQAILHGTKMRIGGEDVFMPGFGSAYSNSEVSALANYVIGRFGGSTGKVTPAEVAKRREW